MPALGWRPSDFWAASLTEFLQAVEGYSELHGGREHAGFSEDERAEVERLKEKYG